MIDTEAFELVVSAPCIACHLCDDNSQNSIYCEAFDKWIKGDK